MTRRWRLSVVLLGRSPSPAARRRPWPVRTTTAEPTVTASADALALGLAVFRDDVAVAATRSCRRERGGSVGPDLDTKPAEDAQRREHAARDVPAPVNLRSERIHLAGIPEKHHAARLRQEAVEACSSPMFVAFLARPARR